jgi:hypothetical protein
MVRPRVAMLAAGAIAQSAQAAPVRLAVAVDHGARLGAPTALHVALDVDVKRIRAPVIELRVLTPRGLDLTGSGLAIATCRLPEADLVRVMFRGPLPGCPANSVLGTGTVTAAIRFGEGEYDDVIPATGRITLFAAPERDASPGLVALVVASNPVRAQLAYAGRLFEAPAPFGIGIDVAVPEIPAPPLVATVGLAALRFTIGGRRLRYIRRSHGRRVSYHPDAIALPARCPRAGFPFRAELRFADATQRAVVVRVPCPAG